MKFSSSSIAIIGVAAATVGRVSAFSPASVARSLSVRPVGAFTDTAARMSTEEKIETRTAAAVGDGDSATAATNASILPEFGAARDSVIETLNAAVETKSMAGMLTHFTNEYFSAASNSYAAGNTEYNPQETAARFMKALELGMKYGMGEDKFTFGVTHKAIRGTPDDAEQLEEGKPNTYDFYKFGCDFFRPAMDLKKSVVLGQENLAKAMEQIEAGENVVFLANHQSEADPQVFSVLLEEVGLHKEATDVIYVVSTVLAFVERVYDVPRIIKFV